MIAVFTRWIPSAFCVIMESVSQALIFVYILTIICGVGGFYKRSDPALFEKYSSPVENNNEDFPDEARKKQKEKLTVSILMGALMVKAIFLPLAVKAMTVMSGIAVLLSTMSLIVSSIVGFTKLAWSITHPTLKVVHANDATWAKDDNAVNYAHSPDGLDYSSISESEHHIHYYQK